MNMTEPTTPLAGWQVLVLRPRATSGALLARLRAAGAMPLALPALRIGGPEDPGAAAAALAAALAAPLVLFTSPAAVAWARRLPGWTAPLPGQAIAVGAGTAAALRRAGARQVQWPTARSDSEGVLALPALADLRGRRVGLVGAPGGRGLIAATLAARGARVVEAQVYRRLPPRFDARHRRRLEAVTTPVALLLSSGEALQHFLAGLAPQAAAVLARARVVAASARLAALAHAAGATEVLVAASAAPADLVATLTAAAAPHAKPRAIR